MFSFQWWLTKGKNVQLGIQSHQSRNQEFCHFSSQAVFLVMMWEKKCRDSDVLYKVVAAVDGGGVCKNSKKQKANAIRQVWQTFLPVLLKKGTTAGHPSCGGHCLFCYTNQSHIVCVKLVPNRKMQGYLQNKLKSFTQLSNLWWMPNSVSKGFDTAMKMGSTRRFKQYPTTYRRVSSHLPFTED